MDRIAVIAGLLASLDPADRRWIMRRLRTSDRQMLESAMPSETAVRRQGDPMARLRRVIGEPATRVEPPRPDSWERSASVTMFVAEVPDGIRPILRALIEGGTQPGLADHGGGRAVRSHARETMLRHLRELAASGR